MGNGTVTAGEAAAAGPAEATDREAVVLDAIGRIRRFAMLPEVTLRVVELVADQKSAVRDLHEVVSTDPVLCMRILKVVNSAFYGLREPVTSIERAIVLLGGEAIKNIALAASLGRIVSGGNAKAAAFARELWVHSLAVAACARQLAQAASVGDPEEAFLYGLLHDVGFVVEMQVDTPALMSALQRAGDGERDLVDIEEEMFGANHQDFGRGLCRQWRLPDTVADAIGLHHGARAIAAASASTRLTLVADALASQQGLGFRGHGDGHLEDAVRADSKLAGVDVAAIAATLEATTRELQGVLG